MALVARYPRQRPSNGPASNFRCWNRKPWETVPGVFHHIGLIILGDPIASHCGDSTWLGFEWITLGESAVVRSSYWVRHGETVTQLTISKDHLGAQFFLPSAGRPRSSNDEDVRMRMLSRMTGMRMRTRTQGILTNIHLWSNYDADAAN